MWCVAPTPFRTPHTRVVTFFPPENGYNFFRKGVSGLAKFHAVVFIVSMSSFSWAGSSTVALLARAFEVHGLLLLQTLATAELTVESCRALCPPKGQPMWGPASSCVPAILCVVPCSCACLRVSCACVFDRWHALFAF